MKAITKCHHGAETAVVVLNFNSATDSIACLSEIGKSKYRDLHVIVVDNASSNEEFENLKANLPAWACLIRNEENLGYAAGNNVGIRHAIEQENQFFLMINPDARVNAKTIAGMVKTAKQHPKAGIVGCRILKPSPKTNGELVIDADGGKLSQDGLLKPSHIASGKNPKAIKAAVLEVDYVIGACMLLSAELVNDIGMIPEDYFLYFEETAYAQLAKQNGWAPTNNNKVSVLHLKASNPGLPRSYYVYYLTRNRMIFAKRFGSAANLAKIEADWRATFVTNVRKQVEAGKPELLSNFDALVEKAFTDGKAGVVGQTKQLAKFAYETA